MAKKRWIQKLEGAKLDDFEPIEKVEELQVIDTVVGKGKECSLQSKVLAHYTGALCKDGIVFQSSRDAGKPLMFSFHEVIEGWREGLPGMREGGKRRLIIPATMAYGASSPSKNIPKHSDLVFDIELVEIR